MICEKIRAKENSRRRCKMWDGRTTITMEDFRTKEISGKVWRTTITMEGEEQEKLSLEENDVFWKKKERTLKERNNKRSF